VSEFSYTIYVNILIHSKTKSYKVGVSNIVFARNICSLLCEGAQLGCRTKTGTISVVQLYT